MEKLHNLIKLAVADMIYGVNAIPFCLTYFSVFVGFPFTFEIFETVKKTWTFFMLVFLFSLVVVSLERVYSTFFPFQHRTGHIV